MIKTCVSTLMMAGLLSLTFTTGHAAEPAPAGNAGQPAATEAPAMKLPDLAVTDLSLKPARVNRARTLIVVRLQNIGTAPAPRTGLIVDCYQLGEEKTPCLGTSPPPLFRVPPLPVGAAREYRVPLARFLPRIGKKQKFEIRARVDTGARIQESSRYNNFRKLEVVY